MKVQIRGGKPLCGQVVVPSDKSMVHRALMLSALADGKTTIVAERPGEDNFSTAMAMRELGCEIDAQTTGNEQRWRVTGVGLGGLKSSNRPIDCGNSGTTIRLLSGLLAGAGVSATLIGDASLSLRPMGRVSHPLRQVGANIRGQEKDGRELAPLQIEPAVLGDIEYRSPVASAQVKSALMFAALTAGRKLHLWEPGPSRDHSERMLAAMGVSLKREPDGDGFAVYQDVFRGSLQSLGEYRVPGDISSAAFFAVAATLIPGSDLRIVGVGKNPTRDGMVSVLEAMGADLGWESVESRGGETVGVLRVRAANQALKAQKITEALIPTLVDELVVLAALAARTEGRFEVVDAEELRVKESDRIVEVGRLCEAFGLSYEERKDGYTVSGPAELRPATLEVSSDHRVAMAAAVMALVAQGESELEGFEVANISYPGFVDDLLALGADAELL